MRSFNSDNLVVAQGKSLQQTSDGGYVITGSGYDPVSDEKWAYIIKTDEAGLID